MLCQKKNRWLYRYWFFLSSHDTLTRMKPLDYHWPVPQIITTKSGHNSGFRKLRLCLDWIQIQSKSPQRGSLHQLKLRTNSIQLNELNLPGQQSKRSLSAFFLTRFLVHWKITIWYTFRCLPGEVKFFCQILLSIDELERG